MQPSRAIVPSIQMVTVQQALSWLGQSWEVVAPSYIFWLFSSLALWIIPCIFAYFGYVWIVVGVVFFTVLLGGLMAVAQEQQELHQAVFDTLVSSIGRYASSLCVLGGIHGACLALSAWIAPTSEGMHLFGLTGVLFLSRGALAMILMLGTIALMCFTPALITLDHLSPRQALMIAWQILRMNVLPLITLSVVSFGLLLVASIPIFIGWAAILPMMVIVLFLAWRDIVSDTTEDESSDE
jgi:hypothetical protein